MTTAPDFNPSWRRERLLGSMLVKPRSGKAWGRRVKWVYEHREELEGARDLDAAYTVICEEAGKPDKGEAWISSVLMICSSLGVRVAGFGVVSSVPQGPGSCWVKIDVDQKGKL